MGMNRPISQRNPRTPQRNICHDKPCCDFPITLIWPSSDRNVRENSFHRASGGSTGCGWMRIYAS